MPTITPAQFFDNIVPEHIKAMKVPQEKRHTYVFRLFGDAPGMWTIDLNRKKVTRGGVNKPDLYMEMDHSDFVSLMGDKLDVQEACLSGRIRYDGNITLLPELGELLQAKAN
jgi:putative sterol carrier protein